jgi:hypothetical protein
MPADLIRSYEKCEWDDPNARMWSVYGHLPQGGVECLADCATPEQALLVYDALLATLKQPSWPELRTALDALVKLYNMPDMRSPSITTVLCRHHLHQDAKVIEEAVAAIRAFPWQEVVTFGPTPARKPDWGFIEIGEFNGTAYTFEDNVQLFLGSNGKVYAEVAEVGQLPDLDDEGHPLSAPVVCPCPPQGGGPLGAAETADETEEVEE